MLELALRDMQRVLPALDVRGLNIRFAPASRGETTLAMHDPKARELVLPPLASKVVLREGVWRLADDAAVGDPAVATVPVARAPARTQRLWPFLGAALLAIIGLLAYRRRRKAHDRQPG